ncbi:hypothetical protein HOO65_050367 [Ceratocystis lukuohia]|uniref:Protein kinase domain-containing protein n=1 Tax=Ceratocystis lukuohia TaxID=2019550 RepID=A0ABR4MG45_9PEZI
MEKPHKNRNLLVIEHKPAHIHTPTLLENALEQIAKSDGSIFPGSMDLESVGEIKKIQKPQTGECTVLLHIDYKEPSELYFHLCVHQKDVKGIPLRPITAPLAQDHEIAAALEDGIKNTPYAIIMTMIQLALNQPNLSPQQIASVQKDLPRYPNPKSPPSDQSPGPNKGNGNGGDGKHPLTLAQLVDIIQTQLDTNLDSDCEVQRHKSGLFGTLVKLTAHPYGYTFVGKGMMDLGLPFIHHELQVYSIHGVFVPVCLGHVSMQQTLNVEFLPIRQMLLMFYAGESASEMDDGVDNIEAQLLALGVVHGDIREENVTHDVMSDCTMLIDFHRARILNPSQTTFVDSNESAAVKRGRYEHSWDDGRSTKRICLGT